MEKQELAGFKRLRVWQKAYELTLQVYKLTQILPKEEMYSLSSQLRRAAASVAANISEGYERNHRKEYVQFLYIAKGSLGELETYFCLAKDLSYITDKHYSAVEILRVDTVKLLSGLIRSLTGPRTPDPGPQAHVHRAPLSL
jgi:four helix bundle protein